MATNFKYKIPTSIKRSMLDHEIVISGGGMQMKPMPLKVILFWIAAIFITLLVVSRTFVKDSGTALIILFIAAMLAVTIYFGQYSKTKEMRFQQLPALIQYLPKGARRVMTRNNSNPYGFMTITGIRSVDMDGLITFVDGGVGQIYSVVGTGSKLLFDDDKEAIVSRVNSFWQKVDTTCEWTFITTHEPQQVVQQIAHAEKLNVNLTKKGRGGKRLYIDVDAHGNSDLHAVLEERYQLLQFVAGINRDGSKSGQKFMSFHQYLVIRASNLEKLQAAHMVLESEVNASSAMFKECRIIDNGKKAIDVLKIFYQGRDKTLVKAPPKKGSLAAQARDRQREQASGGLVRAGR